MGRVVGREQGEIQAPLFGKQPIITVTRLGRLLTLSLQSRESRGSVSQTELCRGKILDRCAHRLENSDLIVRSVKRVAAGQISQFRYDL